MSFRDQIYAASQQSLPPPAEWKEACEWLLEKLDDGRHDEVLKKELTALAAGRDDKKVAERLKKILGVTISDELLRMAYKEYSDEMRHFSVTRSALTTFLLAVGLAAISAYFNTSQSDRFLLAAGGILGLIACAVCLVFSWRTSKAYLYRKRIWEVFAGTRRIVSLEDPDYPEWAEILKRMRIDATNWLLLLFVVALGFAFYFRDGLSWIPELPPKPKVTTILNETVLFPPDRASLDDEALRAINHVKNVAEANPNSIILIWSNTDTTGSEAHNRPLSERRSTQVKEQLVMEGGIAPKRILSSDLANRSLPKITESGTPETQNRSVTIEVRLTETQSTGSETQ